MSDVASLLEPMRALHDQIRASVVEACSRQTIDDLAAVSAEDVSDTIYQVDRVSEETLIAGLAEIARDQPLVLMAEGLPNGAVALPLGTRETDCHWRVIVDPIDGTRGIMYQKRSAWILTGVAPNRGAETRMRDIMLAVQTEIPLVKQHLSDQLWAIRGQGTHATRFNRITDVSEPLTVRPSRAATIAHGFSSVCRFFPGVRDVLAAIDDELTLEVLGPPLAGKAACFEDQYLSTGGQLYELMAGHDRFVADVRPLLASVYAERGLPRGLCAHPYDICTMLIAEELGVVVTGADGSLLDGPFDVESDVSWVGYANQRLRALVEPALHGALRRRGLFPSTSQ
jgi:fructose-1,6-bisphosphatase/inositol monophosphatase family enzyme